MFRLDFKVKRSGYLCTRIFDGQFVGAVAMVIKDPETDDSDANSELIHVSMCAGSEREVGH